MKSISFQGQREQSAKQKQAESANEGGGLVGANKQKEKKGSKKF